MTQTKNLLVAVIFLMALGFWTIGVAAEKLPPKPLSHDPTVAYIKTPYAAVRENPGNNAPLVGYLPGAVEISVGKEVNGWLRMAAYWSYQVNPLADPSRGRYLDREAWIRRNDVALPVDYVIMDDEPWPLEFVLYEIGDSTYVLVFRQHNRCPASMPDDLVTRIRMASPELKGFPVQDMHCVEIWKAIGSDLVYFNLYGSVGWYDRKLGVILMARGPSYSEPVLYGYFDGSIRRPPTMPCKPLSVGCQLSTDGRYVPSRALPPPVSAARRYQN